MGLLSSQKKGRRTVALFDIGSGSIGASFVQLPNVHASIPTIQTSLRTPIAFRNELRFETFLADMTNAVSQSASVLHKQAVGAPTDIVCVLASPWYVSETRVIKITKEHSFIFTQKIADELLEKELASMKALYEKKYGGAASTPELVEHLIVGISLNGYPVADPIGKRTRSVEMHMVVSLSPKVCLDAIRTEIAKTFHHNEIRFSSFMTMSYLAIREKYPASDSYVLLDIGGEVTDVALVYKGILRSSLSFPSGKNSLYKYIAHAESIEIRDAVELFRLYSTGALEEKKRARVEPMFRALEESWNRAFRECIATLPRTLTLPSTIYLTADPDIRKWFVETIPHEEYIQSLFENRTCTIVTQDGPEFLSLCSVSSGVCDPFLMIEAIALPKILLI